MKSIFEKIALMLFLANGEVVRHCHAVLAIIIVKTVRISFLFPKRKSRYNSKRFFNVQDFIVAFNKVKLNLIPKECSSIAWHKSNNKAVEIALSLLYYYSKVVCVAALNRICIAKMEDVADCIL